MAEFELHYAPEPIPEDVEVLLHLVTEMTTSTPTLPKIAAVAERAGIAPEDFLDRLDEAMARGLIDACADHGPETLFSLSTMAAQKLGVCLTWDSRRWARAESGRLIGPSDDRYDPRKPRRDNEILGPLDMMVDRGQARPDEILELVERYSDEHAPFISRFYGMNAIWNGEEEIGGTCPYCGGQWIGIHAYCLKCHNAGADRFLSKPLKSRRRQMSDDKSTLKGGV